MKCDVGNVNLLNIDVEASILLDPTLIGAQVSEISRSQLGENGAFPPG